MKHTEPSAASARGDRRASSSEEINEDQRGKQGAVTKRKSIFGRALAAINGPVTDIRVCDSCFQTESLLASPMTGGGAETTAVLHLDSSSSDDDEDEDDAANASKPAALTPPLARSTSTAALAHSSVKGRLPVVVVEDEEDEESGSVLVGTGAGAGPRGRLERSSRKIRLDESANKTSNGAATASAASSAAASAAAATSPFPPSHSLALCLFKRHFRCGARESLKLLLPDPVLMFLGNKKFIPELIGLGDGGIGGTGATGLNQPTSGGVASIWNHLRSIVHSHPCAHSATNHSSPDVGQHFDCQVPHLPRCAESFPFRYGMLAISNYQLIFIPLMVPPNAQQRVAKAVEAEQFRASHACAMCKDHTAAASDSSSPRAGPHTPYVPAPYKPPTVTSTCCSSCGCMPLANDWEHIASNTIAWRLHATRLAAAIAAGQPPPPVTGPCTTCIPLAPFALPLLMLSRFRLRTFEKADLGELELRGKNFAVARFLFPGLISRNRFASFRNIAIALDWFSKTTKHELAAAAAAASAAEGGADASAAESASGGSEEQHEGVVSLKKICFAFKHCRERDVFPIPPKRVKPKANAAAGTGRRSTVTRPRVEEQLESTPEGPVVPRGADSDADSTESDEDDATAASSPSASSSAAKRPMDDALLNASRALRYRPAHPALAGSLPEATVDGWALYDPLAEFRRLGLLDSSSHYRVSDLNLHYTFSPTYPRYLVVPRSLSDKELEGLAPFRSKARIPTVVWARRNHTAAVSSVVLRNEHGMPIASNGTALPSQTLRAGSNPEVVMLRSAQPLTGITRSRNHLDELFLQSVVSSSPSHKRLLIADARPLANAMAQQAMGKGFELVENYTSHILRDPQITFLEIGNIHVMRESEEALLKLCQHTIEDTHINTAGAFAAVSEACNHTRACTSSNAHIAQQNQAAPASSSAAAAQPSGKSISAALASTVCPNACGCSCCSVHVGNHGLGDSAASFWSALLATGHFEHLGAILRGANLIASTIQGGTSTLVHCSDGWDRTSQLTSLSQLLLDPYYRTIHGFFVLLSKEWLSFGHKMTERLGHGGLGGRENSPVLTQFFDAVYQILAQHPARFEFKPNLLLALRHSVHSGKYGTWLGNSEAEREIIEGIAREGNSGGAIPSSSASATSWRLRERTPSIFSQLWLHRSTFLNLPCAPTSTSAGSAGYEHAPGSGSEFRDYQHEDVRNHPLQVDLHALRFWKEAYMPSSACAIQPFSVLPASVTAAMYVATTAAAASKTATGAGSVTSLVAPPSPASSILTAAALLATQKAEYESKLAEQSRLLEETKAALANLQRQQQQQSSRAVPSAAVLSGTAEADTAATAAARDDSSASCSPPLRLLGLSSSSDTAAASTPLSGSPRPGGLTTGSPTSSGSYGLPPPLSRSGSGSGLGSGSGSGQIGRIQKAPPVLPAKKRASILKASPQRGGAGVAGGSGESESVRPGLLRSQTTVTSSAPPSSTPGMVDWRAQAGMSSNGSGGSGSYNRSERWPQPEAPCK